MFGLWKKIKNFLKRIVKGLRLSLFVTTAVVWRNKKVLIFPLFSICLLAILWISWIFFAAFSFLALPKIILPEAPPKWLFLVFFIPVIFIVIFLPIFLSIFIITFFQIALTNASKELFEQNQTFIGPNLRKTSSKIGLIFKWSLASTIIRLLIGMTKGEKESESAIGSLIQLATGLAWSALTFFIYPVITFDNLGVIGSIKKSFNLLKTSFGETAGAAIGFNALRQLGLLLVLPFLIAARTPELSNLIFIGALLFFTVEILALSFETIFTTAVYQYMHDKPSGPFNVELIETQMKTKPNQ